MNRKTWNWILALPLLLSGPIDAAIGRDEWSTNVKAATDQAQAEHKDLLLNFTGSDWCQFCIQLDKEVFSTEGCLDQLKKDFVLVKLDFPQNTALMSAEVLEQNADWQQRLAISGYPTIALLDDQQRPYAFTGYREGGPTAYLEHLQTLRAARVARDEAFAKAENAEGVECARLLDQGLEALDHQIVEVYYADVINKIIELDPDNAAGLRAKYNEARERELQRQLLSDIAMVARLQSPQVAVEFIDEALAAIPLPPATQYKVLLTKLDLLRKSGAADKAEAVVDQMMAIEGLDSVDLQKLIVKKVLLMFGDQRQGEGLALLDRRIEELEDNRYLLLAKAELYCAENKHAEAIQIIDQAIKKSDQDPEIMLLLVEVKADALMASQDDTGAIAALDAFADSVNWPPVLRAEALLHKAMILRDTDRRRAAILAENHAIEIVEAPQDKAQVQRLVDQLRKKYQQ